MASYDYYKRNDTGSRIPSLKSGSNWFFIRVQPALQPMNVADTLKLFKTKNHWIFKNGLTRITTPTTAAATADIGTTGTGQEYTAALDLDNAADTWTRMTAGDDDAPVAVTADGYVYFECLGAAIYDGVIDLMFEFVIPHTEVGSVTSNQG
jgi:hypothetical protein